jgi:hypothetical protein
MRRAGKDNIFDVLTFLKKLFLSLLGLTGDTTRIIFWDMSPCSLEEIYCQSGGECCLSLLVRRDEIVAAHSFESSENFCHTT